MLGGKHNLSYLYQVSRCLYYRDVVLVHAACARWCFEVLQQWVGNHGGEREVAVAVGWRLGGGVEGSNLPAAGFDRLGRSR